jgi:beta-glucosidase
VAAKSIFERGSDAVRSATIHGSLRTDHPRCSGDAKGTAAGPALVRTLFGESNPSGRLVVSWPRSVGQEPLYYNALNTGRPADNVDLTQPPHDVPSRYVSRYIDEANSPHFPFGYGTAYTTYLYGQTRSNQAQLSAAHLNRGLNSQAAAPTGLIAEADVSNTGWRAGEEIVQLYVRLQGTSTAQPIRALKGFQHIRLAPGETKKVTFNLGPEAFALWNASNQFANESCKVTIWISPDSAHGTGTELEILP